MLPLSRVTTTRHPGFTTAHRHHHAITHQVVRPGMAGTTTGEAVTATVTTAAPITVRSAASVAITTAVIAIIGPATGIAVKAFT